MTSTDNILCNTNDKLVSLGVPIIWLQQFRISPATSADHFLDHLPVKYEYQLREMMLQTYKNMVKIGRGGWRARAIYHEMKYYIQNIHERHGYTLLKNLRIKTLFHYEFILFDIVMNASIHCKLLMELDHQSSYLKIQVQMIPFCFVLNLRERLFTFNWCKI